MSQLGRSVPGASRHASDDLVKRVLARGEIEIQGRFAGSTNVTLLVTCSGDGLEIPAVYKPQRGERSLWDFPPGLHRREQAAYVLSEALGWGLVPTTVLRNQAPLGPGSLQHYLEDDGESHYFTLRESGRWEPVLEAVAVFDVLANNADRKSGHVILADNKVWAIDHGLCFHAEPKLRTVIWDFAEQVVPSNLLEDVRRLVEGDLPEKVRGLLSQKETTALARRGKELIRTGTFPEPVDHHGWPPYPWPLV